MPEVERIKAFGRRFDLEEGWGNASRGWRCGGHKDILGACGLE